MEQRLTWQNLSHQLKILNEGSSLLSKIFSNGVLREIKIEDLTALPEYQSGIADLLINYGVLSEDNGYVAIESPHLEYFLDSQAVNRISVGAVQDSVDQLYVAIQNFQTEKNDKKKQHYLRDVQKVLGHVALQSMKQVTILKHEIREVYKQEPNLEKKIKAELTKMLKNDREKYLKFYETFGLQFKFGIYQSYGAAKDTLEDLLMFASSFEGKPVITG